MTLRIDNELLQYLRRSDSGMNVEVRDTVDVAVAVDGLQRARSYLFWTRRSIYGASLNVVVAGSLVLYRLAGLS